MACLNDECGVQRKWKLNRLASTQYYKKTPMSTKRYEYEI